MRKRLALLVILSMVAAACGGDAEEGAKEAKVTKLTLQLAWVTQAQFAGYYAADELGFYEDEGLDVTIRPGSPDIRPTQVLLAGSADLAIESFGAVLSTRDQGVDVVSIAQIFPRAGYRLISWADENIITPEDFRGKKVGLWNGFNPSFFATAAKHGLDIDKDVTIVNQSFDMTALLNRDVDLASAQTYNEFAQAIVGCKCPPSSFRVFDFNQDATSTLEDTVLATREWLNDEGNQDAAVRFLGATFKGWIYCRDNPEKCVDIVVARGTALPTGFQLWQMNEVNKLIWPSISGLGNLTRDMFLQDATIEYTYEVIKKPATEASFDMTFRDKAVEGFSNEDLFGESFQPLDISLEELAGA